MARCVAPLVLGFALLVACRKDEVRASPAEVVVAAAASLRSVLPGVAASWEKAHPGSSVVVTYGASGELREQVAAGAPVDVIAFAGAAPVDDLIARGVVDGTTRQVIATNTLILVGPKGCPRATFATLAARVPEGERIAIGDPRSVPAGQYAKAALERMNEWEALAPKLVYGGDVSAVLAYARRGEVAAAIVYKTELTGVSDVDLLEELPAGAAPRAEVVVARVTGSRSKEAATSFLAYLEGDEARRALAAIGFGPP